MTKKHEKFLDDGNDLIVVELPEENQKKEIAELKKDMKRKTVRYAEVYAMEPSADGKSINILMKRDSIRLITRAEDFFAYTDFKDLDKDTPANRVKRFKQKVSHMFGAKVSFIVKAVDYNEDGVPFCIVSRKEAMDILREKYFYSDDPAQVGDVCNASIVSVGPRYVTVEALGVETVIGTGALSAYSYIEDASKEYHVGDGLRVGIEELTIDKEHKTVDVKFSHAMIEKAESKRETVKDITPGGRYFANVVAITDKYYIVIINKMKIRGLVRKDGLLGEKELLKGDEVALLVTDYDTERNMVIGKCIKL